MTLLAAAARQPSRRTGFFGSTGQDQVAASGRHQDDVFLHCV
jgi:hypothetical protein